MGKKAYIQNVHSGLVLDIQGGSHDKGAHLVIWNHHGNSNQLWKIKGHTIKSVHSKFVLDIKEPSQKGSPITVDDAEGGSNQKWHINDDGSIRSESGLVLDIQGGKYEEGTPVIAWEHHGGDNQKWRVVYLD